MTTEKLATKEEIRHLEVAWGGAAIVLKTSPHSVQGCYTEGLLTCIGIAVLGENGFAFMHDTLFIAEASIENICWSLGRISRLAIIYNPKIYPDFQILPDNSWIKLRIEKIISVLSRVSGFRRVEKENYFLIQAKNGFVSVNKSVKDGVMGCSFDVRTKPSIIDSLPDMNLRLEINKLNWFFIAPGEEVLIDLHYDGHNYFDLPKFNRSPAQMQNLVKSRPDIFGTDGVIAGSLMSRKELTYSYIGKLAVVIRALVERNVFVATSPVFVPPTRVEKDSSESLAENSTVSEQSHSNKRSSTRLSEATRPVNHSVNTFAFLPLPLLSSATSRNSVVEVKATKISKYENLEKEIKRLIKNIPEPEERSKYLNKLLRFHNTTFNDRFKSRCLKDLLQEVKAKVREAEVQRQASYSYRNFQ